MTTRTRVVSIHHGVGSGIPDVRRLGAAAEREFTTGLGIARGRHALALFRRTEPRSLLHRRRAGALGIDDRIGLGTLAGVQRAVRGAPDRSLEDEVVDLLRVGPGRRRESIARLVDLDRD